MSNYAGFDVKIDNDDGEDTLVPGATVKVRDVTAANAVTGVGAVALADLVSDGNGHVAAGSLAIAAGRVVRFSWFRDLDGRCGSAVQITT